MKTTLKALVLCILLSSCDFGDLGNTSGQSIKFFFSLCYKHRTEFDFDNLYRKDEIAFSSKQEYTLLINVYDNSDCQSNQVYSHYSSGELEELKESQVENLLGEGEFNEEAVYLTLTANFYNLGTFVEGNVFDSIQSSGLCGEDLEIFSEINILGLTCQFNSTDEAETITENIYLYYKKTSDNNRYMAISTVGENFFPSNFNANEDGDLVVYFK